MIEVEVEDEAWRGVAAVEMLAERAAEAALSFHASHALPALRGEGSVSDAMRSATPPLLRETACNLTVLLTDDATVRDLNARFRGKDAATNVLSFPAPSFPAPSFPAPSFPAPSFPAPSFPAPGTARPHLGDIALAHGVCAAEAEAQGKSLADHLSHLVVHGVLHLLGHDHELDAPADAMEACERTILAGLDVEDPYRQDVHVRS